MNTEMTLHVLDDESDFCGFIGTVATKLGFTVYSNTSPQQFIKDYDLSHKQCVFLDLFLPGIDGLELLRFMASATPPDAIILISGADASILKSARKLAEELNLNVVDTFTKPIRLADLKQVLSKLKESTAIRSDKAGIFNQPRVSQLEKAIRDNVLHVEYQPQFDCKTLKITAVEALARWNLPDFGRIPPNVFIAMAEEINLVSTIDSQIMQKSLVDFEKFLKIDPSMTLSVNLSSSSLEDFNLPEVIVDQLKTHNIPPYQMSLELTETAAMQDQGKSLEILTRLRMKGVSLSIDDFGTGHSSMSKLVRFPFSELKIDRSFVSRMLQDKDCLAIVNASISLARELGMQSVAEGVSSQDLCRVLQDKGCDRLQGFGLGMPVSATSIIELLQS